MGIRLVIVDDNPHVSWGGRVHPVNATFQHFAAALLDVPGSPVASITSCVPVRDVAVAPVTRPLDPRILVVATAPFEGIAGYLRHLPAMLRANLPILRAAIADADLVWMKVPASNAPLAAALARKAGVPRFGYVAGSAYDVASAQRRGGLAAVGARAVGLTYDVAGRLASAGGDRLVVGEDLDGTGVVSSLVEAEEISDVAGAAWPRQDGRLRLAWAGRLAAGKGLETLLAAVAALAADPPQGRRVVLDIVGDGPARGALEAEAQRLGVAEHVRWHGYLTDRGPYLDALAAADLFVFPSPAEGFPKVVLDAFAVGLPVIATPSGTLRALGQERLAIVSADDPVALAQAIRELGADPARARDLQRAGSAFAADHTRRAETARLATHWQARFPLLSWH
ncbi:MAG: glycosyltransferase [Candidatus Limnocylindrales bacterium]